MLGLRPALPPTRCSRTLTRGEVKRVPFTGGLIGYFLACPGCGYKASYLASEAKFVEVDDNGVLLVAIERPPPCLGCRKRLRLTDGKLEAA